MIFPIFLFVVFIVELLIKCAHSFILSPSIQITTQNFLFITSSAKNLLYARESSLSVKRRLNIISYLQAIRPTVRCQSQKYKNKFRKGRGFTPKELSQSSISINDAKNMNISIDYRRNSYSNETSHANALLLRKYVKQWEFFKKKEGTFNKLKSGKIEGRGTSTGNKIKKDESKEYLTVKPTKENIKNTPVGKKVNFLGPKNKRKNKIVQNYIDKQLEKIRGFEC